MNTQTEILREPVVRFAGSHGYRIDGDWASLNAELDILRDVGEGAQWALQLWACEEPYLGGPIHGIKVAEAPLALTPTEDGHAWSAEAPAHLPADRREYSMVLVLAAGSPGAFDQIHDFSNFPARVAFELPHFAGAVGYAIREDHWVVRADRIENPRSPLNLSGSLALELWALRDAYTGGALDGVLLGRAELERVAGQSAIEHIERTVAFSALPAGRWQIALVLSEWTSEGYVARDFCNFALPYEAPEPKEALEPEPKPKKVSVQTASVEQLTQIKGINRKLAVEIVKARPFRSLDDLLRVRGIGEKLLRKLRPELSL